MTTDIGDYGIIGDCRSAALISRTGSIDWLCWPRFDSPPVFGRLLDPDAGMWRIGSPEKSAVHRRYVADTNVLETTFEQPDGRFVLTDLMPALSEEDKRGRLLPDHQIIRKITCEEGRCRVAMELAPRDKLKGAETRIRRMGKDVWRLSAGRNLLLLRCEQPLRRAGETLLGEWTLDAGECLYVTLSFAYREAGIIPPGDAHQEELIGHSVDWWRAWVRQADYTGAHRDAVVRSALALKLLVFAPSGAILAAPTTSLPERMGGDLNWDYRFCWVRDAAFTVDALQGLGYEDEAASFINWLLHATRLTLPELSVLYDAFGRVPKVERELENWRGFGGSRPVRFGNGATGQLQLDSYGEVIDAVARFVYYRPTVFDAPTSKMLSQFGEYVCRNWEKPDHGIWEVRGEPRQYTHAKVMCWRALTCLLDLADRGMVTDIPHQMFVKNRRLLREAIEREGWNENLQSYTSTFGGSDVDAALLVMGLVNFHAPSHPRMRATWKRIRQELTSPQGLLYRYRMPADEKEGAFLVCGFWAVQFLASGGGTLEEAHEMFDTMMSCANDLGLYAEEYDVQGQRLLGNFPQGFSLIGLINAAMALEDARRRANERRSAA
jgi:GH15 family glucan-1,4-alpha-glucosidase